MQTKLGSKLNILAERVTEMLVGREEAPAKGGRVKVTQPLATQHQPSQADTMDHSQLLPSNHQLTAMPQIPAQHQQNQPNQHQQQHESHFDKMYQQSVGGNVDTNMLEPMAANEGLSNMFGGSSW